MWFMIGIYNWECQGHKDLFLIIKMSWGEVYLFPNVNSWRVSTDRTHKSTLEATTNQLKLVPQQKKSLNTQFEVYILNLKWTTDEVENVLNGAPKTARQYQYAPK